ncbi:MAG: ATP-binding cassette domain-containing protein [Bacilli bacterium]|nr:ATP-binding cassette domain-containing protein [Bacilli bacterium]
MIEFKDVSITILKNGRPLLKNFNFVLGPGDKFAIIGEEGNGKSTFIKAIYNIENVKPYCQIIGEIDTKYFKIGYLEQQLSDKWNEALVSEYLLKSSPEEEIDYDKYNELAYIMKVLSNLGIKKDILDNEQKVSTLSGGEKVKLQLAKIIVSEPDVLLLDEPTNDLDIETLEWLEDFMIKAEQPIIFVSHDETLLESVANGIIHLEQIKRKKDARHVIERCSYAEYVTNRINQINKQAQISSKEFSEYKQKVSVLKELKEEVRQANPGRPNRMNAIMAQERKISKKELTKKMDVEEVVNIKLEEGISLPNGKVVIDYQLDNLAINNNSLATNIKLYVTGADHIGIIGRNGIGKTTLLRKIFEELKEREDLEVGYMPQNYDESVNLNQKAIDFLINDGSDNEKTKITTFMGSMKFTYEEMNSRIKNLSGGQKAKLFLLKMILDKCNVMLLDEPTRNLSPLTNPAIRNLLSNYEGAIISVSHDRKYLEEVCNKIYELKPSGLYLTGKHTK